MVTPVHRWVVGAGGFLGEASVVEVPALNADMYRTARPAVRLLELTDVYVHPLRRGRGWATRLLQSAVDWADGAGVDLVLRACPYGPLADRGGRALTRLDSAALAKFYVSYGFRPRKGDLHIMVRRCRPL